MPALAGQPANHAFVPSYPDANALFLMRAASRPTLSSQPVAGGIATGPGSECPTRKGGPGGPVADTQHLFVISQGPGTNAETFEPDNTMTLRDRGPLALEPTREGGLVPWTRDAIHRVAERPD